MAERRRPPVRRAKKRSSAKGTRTRGAAPKRATAGSARVKGSSRVKGSARRTLYPPVEAYDTGMLRVSPVHELYYEQSGNPRGKPVVFLHGGPGGGTDPKMRRFFDPRRYRIVLFDQRGCGRSRPRASLEDNTTWHLVDDIETLRAHLGIERWQVFGGSWGSTLALAYAQTHPARVTELVLRGVFLVRPAELRWFYESPEGAASLFPEFFEQYAREIPPEERGDMVRAYYRRLTSADHRVRAKAARAWSIWEGATSYLHVNEDYLAKFEESAYAETFARIECHYFVNGAFMRSPTQLIEDVSRIRSIPCVIVQGRYDCVCPMVSAWELHRAWPEAELRIVPDAGHSAFEAGNIHELVSATDRYARG